jgi:hypothetical protein
MPARRPFFQVADGKKERIGAGRAGREPGLEGRLIDEGAIGQIVPDLLSGLAFMTNGKEFGAMACDADRLQSRPCTGMGYGSWPGRGKACNGITAEGPGLRHDGSALLIEPYRWWRQNWTCDKVHCQ